MNQKSILSRWKGAFTKVGDDNATCLQWRKKLSQCLVLLHL